jgi:segregation and condensation protein B
MRAAGLLDINVPADFMVPDPSSGQTAEHPLLLEEMEETEFAQDFFEKE